MKRIKLLTGLLLIFTSMTFAQSQKGDTLLSYYLKYPQEALKAAEAMHEEALKKKDSPLLIKSIILKTTFSERIDTKQLPALIKDIENFIAKESSVPSKSILHSYIAELYNNYRRQNPYQIRQRTSIENFIPEAMEEWSENIFVQKISEHILASVNPAEALQKIPVSAYDEILIKGKDTELRPTLYDFLANRAIEILQYLPPDGSNFYTRHPDSASSLIAEIDRFIDLKIPATLSDPKTNTLNIYQDLLKFRKKEGNPIALLVADLGRLQYVRDHFNPENSDSLYMQTLLEMGKRYKDSPYVVEILAKQATLLNGLSKEQQPLWISAGFLNEKQSSQEAALQIAENGIKKYPNYKRINLLKNIVGSITKPSVSVQYNGTVYPGKNIAFKITSKNLKQITLEIFHIPASSAEYYKSQDNKDITRNSIYKKTLNIAGKITDTDTTISALINKPGQYEFSITTPEAKKEAVGYFISTQFLTYQRYIEDKNYVFVRDYISGMPVKGATVNVMQRKNNRSQFTYTTIETIRTDENGMALITGKGNNLYEVTNDKNPNGYICNVFTKNNNPIILKDAAINIITDRQIYRPGQKVYFKGIVWKESSDTLSAVSNQRYTAIFRDANNKEISKQSFISNQYGSFAGEFTIPSNVLNGNFSIECNNNQTFITVAEYKRPEFEITFASNENLYRVGDIVRVKGKINTFSGVNLANQDISYEIKSRNMYGMSNDTKNSSTSTNDNGEFEITFTAKRPSYNIYRGIYSYEVKVIVTDSKGETQESSTHIPIFLGKHEPVIEMPEKINKNKPVAFNISMSDFRKGMEAVQVDYSIDKLKNTATLNAQSENRDTIIERNILKGNLAVSGKDSIKPDLKKYESGVYLFTIICNGVTTKQIFYLYAEKDKQPPFATYNWLVEEKTDIKPGESAKVLFGTSAKDTYVNYEIYSGNKLISEQNLVLSNEVKTINIPYRKDFGDKLYLIISFVKDGKYFENIVTINKIRENQKLIVKTSVFRDKLKPGQDEEWEINVTTEKGKNINAEVLAMMYDASLDKIRPYDLYFRPEFRNYFGPYQLSASQCYSSLAKSSSIWSWKKEYYFNVTDFRFDRLNTYQRYYGDEMLFYSKEHSLDMPRSRSAMSKVQFTGTGAADLAENAVISEDKADAGEYIPVSFRENFQETAFFYPQLQTDKDGKVRIKFTVPESTTKWKFIALAHTTGMITGQLTEYVTTSKDIMVRPNLPRFFRKGDHAEVKVIVSNLSETVQKGKATLELFSPLDEKVILARNVDFETPANGNQTVNFKFDIPENIEVVGCRISAQTPAFSDGEQHLLPILDNKVMVTGTKNIYATTAGEHTFSLTPGTKNREDYRLTLELAANPIWYAVLALPDLTEAKTESVTEIAAAFYVNTIAAMIARSNPQIEKTIKTWLADNGDKTTLYSKLEQNSELKAVLLDASPWVVQAENETEQMQSLAQLFDNNRISYLREQMIQKLLDLQTTEGGWSWFKGMPDDRFITYNVLAAFSSSAIAGQTEKGEAVRRMEMQALRYLDSRLEKDYKDKPAPIGDMQIIYLYIRSMYRDIPLTSVLEAHKYYMAQAQKEWGRFNYYQKALTAMAMHRYGMKDVAKNIIKSLRQYAVTTPSEGMYWPNNTNVFYRNSAVQVHTAIMEAFREVEGETAGLELMKQWLLLQKQTQMWENVPSTVDAINALLLTGTNQLTSKENLKVKLGKSEIFVSGNNPLGYIKKSFTASEIKPDMLTVKINKESNSPTWGGLYLQSLEKIDDVQKEKGNISVSKKLFIERTKADGKELVPLDNNQLQMGDKVIARLTFSLDRDMEFMHLQDMRAACFEPSEQVSGNRWKFGTVYYEEVKDYVTNFFFNYLPKGTYVLEYSLRVNQSGEYQDGIAKFQSMYVPQYSSHSDAVKITIK